MACDTLPMSVEPAKRVEVAARLEERAAERFGVRAVAAPPWLPSWTTSAYAGADSSMRSVQPVASAPASKQRRTFARMSPSSAIERARTK